MVRVLRTRIGFVFLLCDMYAHDNAQDELLGIFIRAARKGNQRLYEGTILLEFKIPISTFECRKP